MRECGRTYIGTPKKTATKTGGGFTPTPESETTHKPTTVLSPTPPLGLSSTPFLRRMASPNRQVGKVLEARLRGSEMRQFRLDGKALPKVVHPKIEEFHSQVQSKALTELPEPQVTSSTPRGAGQMYALYGNTLLKRGRCPECGGTSFVQDGVSACCHATIEFETSRSRRMSSARDRRKGPSAQRKQELRELQGGCCFYCGRRFGSYVYRGFRLVWLRVHFDHVVAYAYSRNNYPDNYVAACHICNGLKGSKIFETVDEAKSYLLQRWEKKGIRDELT